MKHLDKHFLGAIIGILIMAEKPVAKIKNHPLMKMNESIKSVFVIG
jgi:hypothetical protein